MLPPPLTAIARGEFFVSPVVQLQSAASEHRDVRAATPTYLSQFSSACRLRVPRRCRWLVPASPYSKCAKRCALRLRNLDKKQPFSYCYEFTNSASLGKRRYVHTAADLHVRPWFSNRAGLESLGRREPFRDTPWVISDNPLNQGARRLFASVAALQLRALKATV
jgi:hypothetical protein